jgi:hypothetical protein
VEYDTRTDSTVWSWEADPRDSFYSSVMGGVQLLSNGNLLFNNGVLGYAREISRSGRIEWGLAPWGQEHWRGMVFQQIKRLDLSNFLALNRDLSSMPRFPDKGSRAHPDLVWAHFSGGSTLPIHAGWVFSAIQWDFDPPFELRGVTVLVNGTRARIFMLFDDFVAFEVPEGVSGAQVIQSVEIYFRGNLQARMSSSPVEAFLGRYSVAVSPVAKGFPR